MTARQQQAYRFFLAKGYVPEGAAAIVGNLSQESGTNLVSAYTLKTDHGSQGIAQWRLDRLTRLEKFAQDNRMDVADLTTQMLYLIDELVNFYQPLNAQLKATGRSVANLTANFMQVFERPAAQYADLPNRIKQATLVLATPSAKPPISVDKTVGTGIGTAGLAGAAAYSWTQGLNGTLTAALVIFTAFALLTLFFYLYQRWQPKTAAVPSASLHPAAELQAALDEFKAVRMRLDAAEAVLLADRKTGDDLLAQVKELKR